MKYVMFRKDQTALTHFVPIIFPESLVHADVALLMMNGPLQGYVPDSAGHLNLIDSRWVCHGDSETLGIPSKPERDTRMIKMNDYGACFE